MPPPLWKLSITKYWQNILPALKKYPNCSVASDCGLALANFTVEYVRRLVRLWPVYRFIGKQQIQDL